MIDCKDEEHINNGVEEIDDKLRKLFVGGLSEHTTEESSKNYFSQYGEVENINILRYDDGKSRKFGFVTYANNDAAKNCLTEKKLKNHRLDEKEIEVKRAMPRGNKDKNASLKTHKIFVGGLDTDVDEETIKSYFEDNFGATVTKVDFIKEKKQEGKEQKRRRFCFLTLDDTDLVDELCIRHFHEVAGTRVEVKKAEPKGSRQRYYGGYYDYGYGPYNDYHGYYNGPDYYNGGYGYGYGPGYGYGGYDYPPQYYNGGNGGRVNSRANNSRPRTNNPNRGGPQQPRKGSNY
ncbi:hypothetical protein ACHWQZ_G003897 [Mnemiopsis leidyi]